MRRAGIAATLSAMLLLPAAAAHAAPAVTNTNDSGPGSLRQSITDAAAIDTVNVPAGTYNLNSELAVDNKELTIVGTAGAGSTVIVARGSFRVFHITGLEAGNLFEIRGVTVTGGAPNESGGGILKDSGTGGDLTVADSIVQGNNANAGSASGAGGGGIFNNAGALTVTGSEVSNNTATATGGLGGNGGGGIHQGGGGSLTITQSSVSQNTATVSGSGSGGGGVFAAGPGADITNSTIDGNRLQHTGVSTGGGGGYFAGNGGGSLNNVTVTGNSSTLPGGGIFNGATTDVLLENTILAGHGASGNCSPTAEFTSNDDNIEDANTCNLTGGGDLPNRDPQLTALAANGGLTRTRALLVGSPAIDAGGGGCDRPDQRGAPESANGCDIGAYEFDGLAAASIPNCSPSGSIPVTMTAAPGEGVDGVNYKVDGGGEQFIPRGPGPTDQVTVPIQFSEGRYALEYWGDFNGPGGDAERHQFTTVLVDQTRPSVAIQSEQKRSIYVITRRATVDVNAADALSGLVGDPSADGERIGTRTRGAQTVTKTATDLCGNLQTASLGYRVLGPGLGVRAVLERMRGRVRIRQPGSASAAQKGRPFVPLSQPREIPIRSLVDTRRGSIRLTSSRSRRATNIQDGVISAGLFQVLQSRRRASKGLTELRLKGSSFRRCRTTTKGAGTSVSRRRIRRLRANVKGRFRTRGRFSAATVRGTDFTVTDRCDGTLTKVTRGRVAVRDFRRKKTVIVRAGKSYLARAPR